MAPQPTSKVALHLAKESVKGTAELAPTESIPIREIDGGRDKTKLPDMSLRGSAVDSYSEADGVYHGKFNVKGDLFADSFGHWLSGIMGEEAVTGAGPYLHAFTALNSGDQQPASRTFWDNYGVNIRRYRGAQVSSLKVSWADNGLITYEVDALTLDDTAVAAPVASYGTLAPLPAWVGTCLIGGVAAYPLSGECNISRNNAEAIHVQDGAQGPHNIWVGALVVEGKLTLLMETDVYYQQFIDNTQPTLVLTFTQTGAIGFTLQMSKCTWRDPKIDRGASYVKLEMGYKALGNTTDVGLSGGYSPLKASLANSRSTVY